MFDSKMSILVADSLWYFDIDGEPCKRVAIRTVPYGGNSLSTIYDCDNGSKPENIYQIFTEGNEHEINHEHAVEWIIKSRKCAH